MQLIGPTGLGGLGEQLGIVLVACTCSL